MATKFDGIIVKRQTARDGYVSAYDKKGRLCWDRLRPERVGLTNDLRKYGAGLHIGQLGWTMPRTTDGYRWVDVHFDNGVQLPVLTEALARVTPRRAEAISAKWIREYRGTRFDADPVVAQQCLRDWIKKHYEPYVDTTEMKEMGTGSEEVYAFTFPSLRSNAEPDAKGHFPIKIGYTTKPELGSIERVRELMNEPAGFPERPKLLLVFRTGNGRGLEAAVHAALRSAGRRKVDAAGREWFRTNTDELSGLLICLAKRLKPCRQRPAVGANLGLADILEEGKELVISQEAASVSLRIRPTSPKTRRGRKSS